ncbi:PspA/IM30 family protein [Patescibacteria group bacterium]|nr:PspA/IM30 family protein [Patescibacteria group bacterium]MBU0963738.1 PspA/IM30 family protein [Patescibacteria group bacterium]
MAGIFDKLRNITLGNIHTLLDAVTDWNAIGSVKQRVRDMGEAQKNISVESAVAKSAVKEKTRGIANLKVQIQTVDDSINLVLEDNDPSNDHMAEPLEAKMIALEAELKNEEAELEQGKLLAEQLAKAAERVSAEYQKALKRMNELIMLDKSAKAQEKAASAMEAVADVASGAAEASVDNVANRIKDRSTRARARMDLAIGSMTDQLDVDMVALQAKDRIAKRRAAMQPAADAPATDAPAEAKVEAKE